MNARSDGLPQSRPRRYPYGVTWDKSRFRWVVKFKRNKRSMWVGAYLTLEQASLAATEWLRNNQ